MRRPAASGPTSFSRTAGLAKVDSEVHSLQRSQQELEVLHHFAEIRGLPYDPATPNVISKKRKCLKDPLQASKIDNPTKIRHGEV